MTSLMARLAGVAIGLLGVGPASSQSEWRDVYACGASKGRSFISNGQGWQDDGIANGVLILKRRGEEFDVVMSDASGATFSAREDGAQVTGRTSDGAVQVLAVYPLLTIETYLFSKPERGRSTVAWTSSKQSSGPADRASVFVSSCVAR